MTKETKAGCPAIDKKASRSFRAWAFSVLIVLFALTPSCKKNKPESETLFTPRAITDRLGNLRHYRLYLPKNRRRPVPLLVYFHGVISEEFSRRIPTLKGYTGSPVEETGLIPFCEKKEIALLVPEPFYEYTFLDCPARGWVKEKEMDGVEAIIDSVRRFYRIDPKRIYLAGISAGAVFCHFLANHRPDLFAALLSHSQAYMDPENRPISPVAGRGTKFGVVFAYTRGDYPQLKEFCIQSEKIYRDLGYRTRLLGDLPPESHRWAEDYNSVFWMWLRKLSR